MGTTLVTGASGFVGSHFMEEMKRRGLPVRGVTRGTVPGLITIKTYGPEMNWSNCLKGVDTVVHLAARVHVMRETASDPLSLFREANVTATVNLARQAAGAGVRRFVFVSSIKVNGERTEPGKPFTAGDPRNPQDPYGISKAEAEVALLELGRQTGMEITIIRPPLVYGPGVRGNFRSLMKWAASGMPSIFAAVKNKRSFVHVENLCDLLITVLDHPKAGNQVLLVSDGQDLSTHELIEKLATAAGRRLKSIPVPSALLRCIGPLLRREAAIARLTDNLQVDIERTCRHLEWFPRNVATSIHDHRMIKRPMNTAG
ncbi:NAD-dependent epimerase/dehydratase family protein [Rhizobium sp. 'Codium 1']|uniref:NAD-dependent epimerase/dehydratase family protein n=1 Tax=Rhizobium sp. 'Codium 1' TaxID=2940484 RepID=UPI001E61491E|nr:NAD-dependent epimerase/dehydratase family protein [Rhizobium sp. 'Codium 1']MCC8934861.1 NAD-dependent epimerase/dehydratase family protein [Rhizobium sp. 'Codium 1']